MLLMFTGSKQATNTSSTYNQLRYPNKHANSIFGGVVVYLKEFAIRDEAIIVHVIDPKGKTEF